MSTGKVVCAACGVPTPIHRTADLETPHGPLSLCLACHPTESVLSDSTRRQAHD